MVTAVALGVGFGALAAANVGPIWLLCARTAARFGWRSGASIGMGAAIVDMAYAGLGALGAAALLEITGLRLVLGIGGSLVVVFLGVRTIHSAWRIRQGMELVSEVVTPGTAFRTGLIATASNPVTVLTWGAIFTSVSLTDISSRPTTSMAFVLGIGVGSALVHLLLAAIMARVGRSLNRRILTLMDMCVGLVLIILGTMLGIRAFADSRMPT